MGAVLVCRLCSNSARLPIRRQAFGSLPAWLAAGVARCRRGSLPAAGHLYLRFGLMPGAAAGSCALLMRCGFAVICFCDVGGGFWLGARLGGSVQLVRRLGWLVLNWQGFGCSCARLSGRCRFGSGYCLTLTAWLGCRSAARRSAPSVKLVRRLGSARSW